MKRLFSLVFAVLVLAPLAAWGDPAVMMLKESHFYRQREVMDNAWGSHCGYNEVTEITRCRSFDIHSYANSQGEYDETGVTLYQSVSGPNQWGWRYVSCPVPQSALLVKPKSATVDVTFDTQGPGCWGWGYRETCDPEEPWVCEPSDWSYFGMATLQAELSSPGIEHQYRETHQSSYKDNVSGTTSSSRATCDGGSAQNVLGGGFTMFGDAIFGDAWFAFDTEEADGQFSYRKCSQMDKAKVKD